MRDRNLRRLRPVRVNKTRPGAPRHFRLAWCGRTSDFPQFMESLEARVLLSGAAVQEASIYQHILFDPRTGLPAVADASGVLSPLGSASPYGLSPWQIRSAYGVDSISLAGITGTGAGQTIAIIDAYDDPSFVSSTDSNFVNSDLHKFDVQYGLPDPPSFLKLDQNGGTSYPTANKGWALEIALDVEWAHSMAPQANIVLIEANSAFDSDLIQTAVNTARNLPGVSVISMSFGGSDTSDTYASIFSTPASHQGITFLASTGDNGSPSGYPAYSANVVAVGGTTLTLSGSQYFSETGWSGSGGGQSLYISEPTFQRSVQSSGFRQAPDIAFDADPNSGASVYDSYGQGSATPWVQVGGTSLSSPCWAGLIAIADQLRASQSLGSLDGPTQTLPALYSLPAADFHDVISGSNGGFSAHMGYDEVTGRGSPIANLLVPALATAIPPRSAFYTANMDTDPGWTYQGQWAWGQPLGGSGDRGGPDPTSGFTGTNVVGYNLSGGYSNNMSSSLYTTTQAINCTGRSAVTLEFHRWLGVDQVSRDQASIQVSADGNTWTTVWQNPSISTNESSWSDQVYDLSPIADNQPTVYIRWGMGPTNSTRAYCGWNIDDVILTGTATADTTPPSVVSLNRSGASPTNATSVQFAVTFGENVTGVDTSDFALALTGSAAGTIASVTGSGASYTVTVNSVTGNGSLGLNLVDDDSIIDTAGNPLGGTGAGNGNFTGQVYTLDHTAPSVLSINRSGASPTNATSLQFAVTFSESVTGIDTSDFALALTGSAAGTISNVSGSGTSYTVTVNSVAGDGNLGLNLVDNDSIVDTAGNPLGGAGTGNGNFTGQAYTLDHTSPSVLSINRSGASPTNATSVQFAVTFSESVTGVDTSDFALALTGSAAGTISNVSGSGTSYTVTVNSVAGNGNLGLNLVDNDTIVDGVGNKLGGTGAGNGNFTGQVYALDHAAPSVVSINRSGTSPTNATSVQFAVTFSESVTGVDTSDFALALTGSAAGTISNVTGSGTSYTVTVNSVAGNGNLGLNLVDNDTIVDSVGNPLGGTGAGNGNFTGQVYTLDHTPPSVVSINRSGASPTNATSVQFAVTFSESVTGVDTSDFALALSGTAAGTISNITGSGTSYTVTVNSVAGDGSVGLNLVDDDSIIDSAGNPLGGAGAGNGNFTGQAYTLDHTAPAPPVVAAIDADTGSSSSDAVTSDQTLILSGTAEALSLVTLTRQDLGVIGTCTTNATGTWSFDYTGTVLLDGTYTFTATATDAVGNVSGNSAPLNVKIDTTAPSVQTTVVNNGQAQRSFIGQVAVQFSEGLSPAPLAGVLHLHNNTTNQDIDLSAAILSYNPTTHTATWNLTAVALPDGNYAATLTASGLTDQAGNTLQGGNYNFTFFRLAGDADGDGTVGGSDYAIWLNNFGTTGVPAGSPGDLDGDGTIGGSDYAIWLNNFGTSVPLGGATPAIAPTLSQPATASTSTSVSQPTVSTSATDSLLVSAAIPTASLPAIRFEATAVPAPAQSHLGAIARAHFFAQDLAPLFQSNFARMPVIVPLAK